MAAETNLFIVSQEGVPHLNAHFGVIYSGRLCIWLKNCSHRITRIASVRKVK